MFVWPRRGSLFGGCLSWGVSVAFGPILVPIWVFVGPWWWTRLGDRIWSRSELVFNCGFVGGGRWWFECRVFASSSVAMVITDVFFNNKINLLRKFAKIV